MKPETSSKIILTVIIVTAMATGLYIASTGGLVYGMVLSVGGFIALLWVWKP